MVTEVAIGAVIEGAIAVVTEGAIGAVTEGAIGAVFRAGFHPAASVCRVDLAARAGLAAGAVSPDFPVVRPAVPVGLPSVAAVLPEVSQGVPLRGWVAATVATAAADSVR